MTSQMIIGHQRRMILQRERQSRFLRCICTAQRIVQVHKIFNPFLSQKIAAIVPHSSLGSPALHLTHSSSQHLDNRGFSFKVHRREPCHVRSVEPLFRLFFIVRQPLDCTRLELTERILLPTSPFHTLETFTLQSHKLSVFDAAIQLKWLK